MGAIGRKGVRRELLGLGSALALLGLTGCSFFGGGSAPAVRNWEPALSPDGTRLAYEDLDEKTYEIYVRTLSTGEVAPVTQNAANDWAPSWSPDGERIVFVSERNKNVDLYVIEVGTLTEVRLTDDSAEELNPSWGTDGRVYFNSNRSGVWEIYSVNGEGKDLVKITGAPAAGTGG